ncbi:hypothetical protein GCM10023189_51100 [Nibrella saemangeumensis]|uniref:Por secretion system C-terminal sorting domain-containing protein n=1 Tax=Nibrella saemangeumensis TaxID=1084526 RepID=A0ABP8NKJ9_9BACT
MKTLITTIALALTLSATSLTASADSHRLTGPKAPTSYRVAVFPSSSAAKLNVIVEKAAGRVEVRLKDAKGHVLHTSYLQKKDGKFWSRFDMSELQDGTYTVEIDNGAETTAKEVTLSTKATTFSRVAIID